MNRRDFLQLLAGVPAVGLLPLALPEPKPERRWVYQEWVDQEWRFVHDSLSWTDEEIQLNEEEWGDGDLLTHMALPELDHYRVVRIQ